MICCQSSPSSIRHTTGSSERQRRRGPPGEGLGRPASQGRRHTSTWSLRRYPTGTRLATVSAELAPPGQRMLLGAADGVVILPGDPAGPRCRGRVDGHGRRRAGTRRGARARDGLPAPCEPSPRRSSPCRPRWPSMRSRLAQWHDRHSQLRRVRGRHRDRAGRVPRAVCPQCGAQHFPRTDPAVIMLVVDDDDRCLLGHNAARDATWYSTLAGFVEPGESLEDAVVREVAEETGVAVDSRHLCRQPAVAVPVVADARLPGARLGTAIAVDGVEITKARWFTRDELRREVEAGAARHPLDDLDLRRSRAELVRRPAAQPPGLSTAPAG